MTERKTPIPEPKKEEPKELADFSVVLSEEEVKARQKELIPLTPEEIAEINLKIKEVQDKANSEIQEIMIPAVQADPILSKAVTLDTKVETDHILYIIEIETEKGKEKLERRWYFGSNVKEEYKGRFITTKITPPAQ